MTAHIHVSRTQARAYGITQTKSKKRGMNKLEAEYAALLAIRVAAEEIGWYAFEPIRLRLADGAWFKPDFAVMRDGKLEFHEVKGFMREAAMVRLKVAADLYPFRFRLVKKIEGRWTITDVPGMATR